MRAEQLSYQPRTPWSPLAALMALGVILVAAMVGGVAGYVLTRTVFPDHTDAPVAVGMLAMQVTGTALTILAAAAFGGARWQLLALDRWPPVATLAVTMAGMLAIMIPYNIAVFHHAPQMFAADLAPVKKLIESPAGLLFFVVIALGAPASEELAFRGFLLPALAKSGLRFAGAAVVTSALWTVLHAGYSLAGLLEVFLIGLYLSAALWRTGMLWVPLVCHGLYNALLFAILPYLPMPG